MTGNLGTKRIGTVKMSMIWLTLVLTLTALFLASWPSATAARSGSLDQIATLRVDAGTQGRLVPSTLFGLFFEEINHAGAGGLWAELVSNRGFEAGGQSVPSGIEPWYSYGSGDYVWLETDRSSFFDRNPIALRVTVLCVSEGANRCPDGGVGVINPGYWGMNIEKGQKYRVTFWLRATTSLNLAVKFLSKDAQHILAQENLIIDATNGQEWQEYEVALEAFATDHQGVLALTSSEQGVFWLDQVSAVPVDTFKGHGFRADLAGMLADLKPGFLRFPGGCYVEGDRLQNAWRWRDTVGPWQNRPGHYGDVWGYWSDDGLGFYEFLQLAEDINAAPVWVFNNGIAHNNYISADLINPFVKDTLDGLEFARGPSYSKWGAVRTKMGHPEPFPLYHVAVGNEDCWKSFYRENYLPFFNAIKKAYPDINIISNCDATTRPLDHPADMYDYHIYTNANNLFYMTHQFDQVSRAGPKVFVSEYAVTGQDSGHGTLLAAIAEAAFMIGLELNSDVVEMASYAPLFVHEMDRRWNPDAIVFNAYSSYGTPSYWVQRMFKHSSGSRLLPFTLVDDLRAVPAIVSAIRRNDYDTGDEYIEIKAVNFGTDVLSLHVLVEGNVTGRGKAKFANSTIATISSSHVYDENSFDEPRKVSPQIAKLDSPGPEMNVVVPPFSFAVLNLKLVTQSSDIETKTSENTGGHSDM